MGSGWQSAFWVHIWELSWVPFIVWARDSARKVGVPEAGLHPSEGRWERRLRTRVPDRIRGTEKQRVLMAPKGPAMVGCHVCQPRSGHGTCGSDSICMHTRERERLG